VAKLRTFGVEGVVSLPTRPETRDFNSDSSAATELILGSAGMAIEDGGL